MSWFGSNRSMLTAIENFTGVSFVRSVAPPSVCARAAGRHPMTEGIQAENSWIVRKIGLARQHWPCMNIWLAPF
jgi:hypothetical protein